MENWCLTNILLCLRKFAPNRKFDGVCRAVSTFAYLRRPAIVACTECVQEGSSVLAFCYLIACSKYGLLSELAPVRAVVLAESHTLWLGLLAAFDVNHQG